MHLHPHLNSIPFSNAWRKRHPLEKVAFGAGFLVLAMILRPLPWALVILAVTSVAAVAGARIPLRTWLTVLAVPSSFALLTALGLFVEFHLSASGVSVGVVPGGLKTASGLFIRSLAAISCLTFIGWTTPLTELLPSMERCGTPSVFIDLSLLIYRFAFGSVAAIGEMRRAQLCRMGRAGYRVRLQAVSMLAGTVLVRCVERSARLERGLECRGYRGSIPTLRAENAASGRIILATVTFQLCLLAVASAAGGWA